MNLSEEGFMRVVQVCYDWDEKRGGRAPGKIFHLFVGGVSIHIADDDFPLFNAAVQQAAAQEMKIIDFLYGEQIQFANLKNSK